MHQVPPIQLLPNFGGANYTAYRGVSVFFNKNRNCGNSCLAPYLGGMRPDPGLGLGERLSKCAR